MLHNEIWSAELHQKAVFGLIKKIKEFELGNNVLIIIKKSLIVILIRMLWLVTSSSSFSWQSQPLHICIRYTCVISFRPCTNHEGENLLVVICIVQSIIYLSMSTEKPTCSEKYTACWNTWNHCWAVLHPATIAKWSLHYKSKTSYLYVSELCRVSR